MNVPIIAYQLDPILPPYRAEFHANSSLIVCTVRHLPVIANRTLTIHALKEILGVTFWPYNQSFIDQVCSVKMAGYWSRSFLRFYGPRLRLDP